MNARTPVDSRLPTTTDDAYADSGPDSLARYQPLANDAPLARILGPEAGHVIDAVYYALATEEPLCVDVELARELQAWDALSDEALVNFEREIA